MKNVSTKKNLYDVTYNKVDNVNDAAYIEEISYEDDNLSEINFYKKHNLTINLRNTYHVPAGREVVVKTADGERKYTGGQFVPPEQLARSSERAASGGSKGNEGGQEGGQAAWDEIFEQFKGVDPNNISAVNKATYAIDDYVVVNISTSSKKVLPVTRYATDLCIANIVQNIQGIQGFLQEIPIKIQLLSPQDVEQKTLYDDFKQIVNLNFNTNSLQYWQNGKNVQELFQNTVYSISMNFSLFIIHFVSKNAIEQGKQLPEIQKQVTETQNTLQNRVSTFIQEHKGKEPKPGQNAEIDDLSQQLEQQTNLLQQVGGLGQVLEDLEKNVEKEQGFDGHVNHHLSEKDSLGMYEQFAETIAKANLFSMGRGKSFMMGIEFYSQTHPDTMKSIKRLLTLL